MKKILLGLVAVFILVSCQKNTDNSGDTTNQNNPDSKEFNWNPENFADIKIVRYQIPSWDKLSLKQQKLVYYLTQAGLSGRDIIWDQNYRHNLSIRKTLEVIAKDYKGDKETADFKALQTYTKRVMFANGIHHHYSMDKFKPGFSKDFFTEVTSSLNLQVEDEVLKAIFDPNFDNKKVNLDVDKGLVKGSAVNFYAPDITEAEVDAYYAELSKDGDREKPLSYGLNSKVIRAKDGSLTEAVYSAKGMYKEAIVEIIGWLEKAVTVAENDAQAEGLRLLIEYYKTGDLQIWDDYNVAWVKATAGDIDYINSFIEVYNDPKGYKGSYENIIQINDFDMSQKMKVLSDNAQYFEDNSSIMDAHKKKNVTGVTYKVVNVAGEAGDASPSTPIGVNLPNANWIRSTHGSKSVSLGNIISGYAKASGKGFLEEFVATEEERAREKEHGAVADKLHTALHEVIGHASGIINKGVGTPKETMKSYASTLEEARADLVGLYYLYDEKIIELGLSKSLDVGKAAYDNYILNGLFTQLRRLEPGKDIEESHMRNRQLNAAWAMEKGAKDNVVEQYKKDGKTYFRVNDYAKLRVIFGDLLKEIQRIKSEGDYKAGRDLVENYGVKVDPALHKEVLERAKVLKSPPYGGFINPKLVAVTDKDGNITEVNVEYPNDFMGQMMEYGKTYGFLPNYN